jgi:adenylate cyclase
VLKIAEISRFTQLRISLRMTLLTTISLLVATTVLVVGIISYRNARFTANNLAQQLLEQTMGRIEAQIENLLGQATKLNALTERRLKSRQIRADDFDGFVRHAVDAIELGHKLSGFFIGLESTGESIGVSKLSARLSIWKSRKGSRAGTYEVGQFWPTDYPEHPFALEAEMPGLDIRARPWYVQACQARRSVWTDVSVFLGIEGVKDVHGLSYATPIYGDEGGLLAVLDSDFELHGLCRFLSTLKLGRHGFAFVIGRQADGTQQVIAHPDLELLTRRVPGGEATVSELIPPAEFPDPRVSALAAQLRLTGDARRGAARSPSRFVANGEAYLAAVKSVDPDSGPPWVICAVIPESEVLGQVERSMSDTLFVGLGVLAMALLVSRSVSTRVSQRLERLASEAHAVRRFDFGARPVTHSIIREIDDLAAAVEDMKGGLRSFRKYIPTELFRACLSSGREAEFGGVRRNVTIFFSDVVSFTAIAEDLKPEQLVDLLREYQNTVCNAIEATGGTVDKFIGDAVMAFWDTSTTELNHATAACITALRCQSALNVLHERWRAAGKQPFRTRIGLHTGEVVVGNIGSDARLNYTIIGDAVNVANRLEGLNVIYGTDVLISESTYKAAALEISARPIDYVAVRGRRLPVLIYQLLGLKTDDASGAQTIIPLCAQGLECYRSGEWKRAIAVFEEVLRYCPGDPPALLLIDRCRSHLEHSPELDWDGVFRMGRKQPY